MSIFSKKDEQPEPRGVGVLPLSRLRKLADVGGPQSVTFICGRSGCTAGPSRSAEEHRCIVAPEVVEASRKWYAKRQAERRAELEAANYGAVKECCMACGEEVPRFGLPKHAKTCVPAVAAKTAKDLELIQTLQRLGYEVKKREDA